MVAERSASVMIQNLIHDWPLDLPVISRVEITRLPNMTNRQIPEVTDEAWAKARRRMLSFAGSLNVFVALDPADMRKGFNGLPRSWARTRAAAHCSSSSTFGARGSLTEYP